MTVLKKFCPNCDLVFDPEHYARLSCSNCGARLVLHRLRPIEKPVKATTKHQKKVLIAMLAGATISREGHKYRVRDRKYKPLHRLSINGFLRIKKYIEQRSSDHRFVISKKAIAQARPNTWIAIAAKKDI